MPLQTRQKEKVRFIYRIPFISIFKFFYNWGEIFPQPLLLEVFKPYFMYC